MPVHMHEIDLIPQLWHLARVRDVLEAVHESLFVGAVSAPKVLCSETVAIALGTRSCALKPAM